MLHIGCHLSVSQGFLHMGEEALSIGADTFQFFTRNPRGGSVRPLDTEDMAALNRLMEEHHFAPILAHAPYTLNGCSKTEKTRVFAREAMADDLRRLEYLDNCRYNFHPGSHVGQGAEAGIDFIADMLNTCMFKGQKTTVLLETMAGKGTEVGRNFEEIAAIIEKVELQDNIGVCLDTCHVFDGGYDIVDHLDDVLTQFDTRIGLSRLKAVHINDSKNEFGSHKDRHEKIGEGHIGIEAFTRIINHPALRQLPFYLETPNELAGYAHEISLLRSLYNE
jgi:deoxyribonuclease-4